MSKKEGKTVIIFDEEDYSPEETKQAYLDLFKVLQRIQLRQIQVCRMGKFA